MGVTNGMFSHDVFTVLSKWAVFLFYPAEKASCNELAGPYRFLICVLLMLVQSAWDVRQLEKEHTAQSTDGEKWHGLQVKHRIISSR